MASQPLPSGGVANSFGQLVDSIYSFQEDNAANLINSIYDELTAEGTPRTNGKGSPVETGALKTNWWAGIRPNSNYVKRPKDGSSVPFIDHRSKTYGIHYKYYIWNNTPYLGYVNAGDTWKGPRTGPHANIKFIEKAIARGETNANATLSAVGSAGVRATRKSAAIGKIMNMPFF